jgi:hypothetical protein
VFSSYQVARPVAEYRALLEPRGVRYDCFVPDGFRSSGVGFHIFVKES